MNSIELLTAGYRMGTKMVVMMCDDLSADEFHHQPVAGANSAAWIVGHLAVTMRRTAARLGATDLPELTEEFVGNFSQTKKAATRQSELGEKNELLALLSTCSERLMDALQQLPFESLRGPSPTVGPFATNYAEAILFGSLHLTMHCGQLSTIRRSLGKPPLV